MRLSEPTQATLGVTASAIGALLVWVLMHVLAPAFTENGAPLPAFTAWWIRWSSWVWLLPLGVSALWWVLRGTARRCAIMCTLGMIGALVLDGISVIAAFLPIIYLPEAVMYG